MILGTPLKSILFPVKSVKQKGLEGGIFGPITSTPFFMPVLRNFSARRAQQWDL